MPTGGVGIRHHLVVVGASAGGLDPLRELVAGLPADFAAAVAVVIHLRQAGPSALPEILGRAGPLPAEHAADGTRVAPGRIYAGPPGRHLTVEGDHFRLDAGPLVDGHRPAIDRLFETAAEVHGDRTAGVVLSGMLDDGARGLAAVQRGGGLTIVQDPAEAVYRAMPRAALDRVDVAFVLRAAEIGPALSEWVTIEGQG